MLAQTAREPSVPLPRPGKTSPFDSGEGRGEARGLVTGRSGAFKDLSLSPKDARRAGVGARVSWGCGCPFRPPEAPLPLRTTVLSF